MSRCRSRTPLQDRELRGGVARITHNWVGCQLSFSKAREYTRTNDEISVTGLDIGDYNVYAAVGEEEARGEGVIYR